MGRALGSGSDPELALESGSGLPVELDPVLGQEAVLVRVELVWALVME